MSRWLSFGRQHLVNRYDALRASTEVDENGGRHLTRLQGWKQIPCETEAGVQLVLFTSPFVNLVRTQFLGPDFVVSAFRR